jgi:hypothetical protein
MIDRTPGEVTDTELSLSNKHFLITDKDVYIYIYIQYDEHSKPLTHGYVRSYMYMYIYLCTYT